MSTKSPRISECSTAPNFGFNDTKSNISGFGQVKESVLGLVKKITSQTSVKKIRVKKSGGKKKLKKSRVAQKWVFDCKACNRPISERDVRTDNAVYALDATWHRSHLVCYKCGCPIGDEHRPFLAGNKPDGTKSAICLDCHMSDDHDKCTVCDKILFERCIEVKGKKMHKMCFVCERCKAPFEDGKYVMLQDKPYDIDCYFMKYYESSFANGNLPVDYPQSPPPVATMSDSSTTLSTTSEPNDAPTYKKKNTEFVSLTEFAGLDDTPKSKIDSDKTRSSENLDVDVILAKPSLSSETGTILLGPTSKEKTSREKLTSREKMPGSKEKVFSKETIGIPKYNGSKESVGESAPLRKKKEDDEKYTPPKERLEDFVNNEETSKKDSKDGITNNGNNPKEGASVSPHSPTITAKTEPESKK